jgi:hypothetical protein
MVDDVLVESTVATAAAMGDRSLRGRSLLRRYLEWETQYASEQNGWALRVPPVTQFEVNGHSALAWTYVYPSPIELFSVETTGALYITVAVDHVVFILASPLRGGPDIDPATRIMFDAIQTIEQTPEPFDVNALAREIKALDGSEQWVGCSR